MPITALSVCIALCYASVTEWLVSSMLFVPRVLVVERCTGLLGLQGDFILVKMY
jgi:hypothetical protein